MGHNGTDGRFTGPPTGSSTAVLIGRRSLASEVLRVTKKTKKTLWFADVCRSSTKQWRCSEETIPISGLQQKGHHMANHARSSSQHKLGGLDSKGGFGLPRNQEALNMPIRATPIPRPAVTKIPDTLQRSPKKSYKSSSTCRSTSPKLIESQTYSENLIRGAPSSCIHIAEILRTMN